MKLIFFMHKCMKNKFGSSTCIGGCFKTKSDRGYYIISTIFPAPGICVYFTNTKVGIHLKQ